MKRLLLLLSLFLVFGCLEPTQTCPVSQYLDQGVAVTYLETDFKEILSGNKIVVSYDITNLGESTAEDITAEIVGPDNFYVLDENVFQDHSIWTLYPPDPAKCLEGKAISEEITLGSRSGKQTPLDGVPIRLKISYKYTSRSWADLIVMSKEEWDKTVQSGERPRGNQWESAAPVKVKITVPDSPIVPESDESEDMAKPIRIKLEYGLGGEIKAVVNNPNPKDIQICAFEGWREPGEYVPNCVGDLRISLQEGLTFETEHPKNFCGGIIGPINCVFGPADNDGNVREAYLRPAKVSPDKQRTEEYVLWVTVTENPQNIVQETFKIYADATYTMQTIYETDKVVINNVG